MTNCSDISVLLDDYLNATLGAADRVAVDEHLAGCAACRAELAALRAIVADARALPSSIIPPADLWSGIEGRLRRSARGKTILTWGPQLWGRIAAAIGFILLGAGLATVWQRPSDTTGFAAEQARYAAASTALAQKLAVDPPALSPGTRAVVERNLAIVDAAIREAELALESDPGNGALEQMLRVRYEQRLDLLRRATDADRRQS